MKFSKIRKPVLIPLAAALSVLIFAGLTTAGHRGGRDYAQADRLIDQMKDVSACLVDDYKLEIRGVRPTNEQRSFSSAIGYVDNAVDGLRDAFDDDRGFSRVHYKFNQVENKFKGAAGLCDRARVSPSARRHIDSLRQSIAAFKRLRSSQYGLGD